jgi:DNA-binding transcriptional ArsR family regulator
MSEMLGAALRYERRDWPVLPLKAGQKAPHGELVPHGHKEATTDLELINLWWSAHPESNVGVRVGMETDLLVIDIDMHDIDGKASLRSLEEETVELPETYTNETAGNGQHYFFKFPDELNNVELKAQLAPGVDLKHNGYVVMPPSVVNGKAYKNVKDCELAELPPQWVELCKKQEPTYEEWTQIRRAANPNGESFCEQHGLSMSDVLPRPADAKSISGGYLCKHSIHGATGDGNLFVNERLNLWCCYRHHTGGDALTWKAVAMGLISCEQAGRLDGDTFKVVIGALKDEGVVQDDSVLVDARETETVETTETNLTASGHLYVHDPKDPKNAIITINGDKKEFRKLSPIPQVAITGTITDIAALIAQVKEHFSIEEDYNIEGPVCAVLSSYLPNEPDIIGIVQPSGGLKTEILRMFGESENQFCYPLSSVTENTFVSGFDKNLDTTPLLRGRPIIVKDLTTLLSKREDTRSAIFADFREITDGYIRKEFGSGVKKEYHNIHSSLIFGSTPAIEHYYSLYSNLGARMVFLKPHNDPKKAREQSRKNQGKIKQIREELNEAMLSFLDFQLRRLDSEGLPELTDEMAEQIGEYCDFLAVARYPVHYDHRGEADQVPTPEFPTRLNNTISKLAQVHAFIFERGEVGEADREFALRICADNVPIVRAKILLALKEGWLTTSEISERCDISTKTLNRKLSELQALGICDYMSGKTAGAESDYYDGRSNHYKLSSQWVDIVQKYRPAICKGVGTDRNTCTNKTTGVNPSTNCWSTSEDTCEIREIPQNRPSIESPEPNHSEPVKAIRDVIISWRNASSDRNPPKVNRTNFVNLVSATVRRQHPELTGRDIEGEIKRLEEADAEIQALLAELTDAEQ